jgi:hypothetical protein
MTPENWQSYGSRVKNLEQDYWEKDGCMENTVEWFIAIFESSNIDDGDSEDSDLN